MGLIRILDHVDHCYSNADGDIIRKEITQLLLSGSKVIVSFQGVDSASSSFINSAFIELLDKYDFTFIKQHIKFADSTRTINETIKRRFSFEVNKSKELLNV